MSAMALLLYFIVTKSVDLADIHEKKIILIYREKKDN